jgi:hypothetical protein
VKNSPSVKAAKVMGVCSRLSELATELERGESFPVTRLTCLKAVCADHELATTFALYLANLAGGPSRMPGRIPAQERRLLSLSRRMLAPRRPIPRRPIESPLWDLLRQLEELQNEYKSIPWGLVRLIKSRRLLVVEEALHCVLSPYSAPCWACRAARDYAERSDARSPHGLVRASAPAIRDMARFWCRKVKADGKPKRSAGAGSGSVDPKSIESVPVMIRLPKEIAHKFGANAKPSMNNWSKFTSPS